MLAYQAMAQDVKPMKYEGRAISTPTDSPTPASTSATQPSFSSDQIPDAVSSLRALALSTMRSKRRKEVTGAHTVPNTSLPIRPAAPNGNSVLLDYGSEAKDDQDPSDMSALPVEDTSSGDKSTTPQTAADGEVREEGEISDEETQTSSASSSIPPVSGTKDSSGSISAKPSLSQLANVVSTMSTKSDSQRSPLFNFNEQSAKQSPVVAQDRDLWNNWVPSEDHVRPGLKMNMDQFNLVKELVLDLLGWGVSPEYLVDCGLTREAVFYTFTELNLRLPKNLDVTGLLPSPPRDSAASNSTQPSSLPLKANSGMPPPSNFPLRSDVSPFDAYRPSLSHPLPAKPLVYAGASSASSTSPAATTSQTFSNGQNLSDMEAQRKQELQARKAVLASRRKKALPATSGESPAPSMSSATPSAIFDGSIVDEPMPLAPTEAVDDFLKSMLETAAPLSHSPTPAPTPKARTLSGGVALGIPLNGSATHVMSPSPVTSASPSAMDVDSESVPGSSLQRNRSASLKSESPASNALPVASSSTSGGEEAAISAAPAYVSARSITPRNSIHSSTGLTPPPVSLPERPSKTAFIPASPTPTQPTNGRRGTKRPVAMDFVDVEHNSSGPSRTDTSMPAPPPFVRRKLAGFAGLGRHASRRCVIDLSDSEDDERGEAANEGHFPGSKRAATPTNQNVLDAALTLIPVSRPPTTRPPSSAGLAPTKPASPGLTPASLMEKEQQIKHMKELIARREQERLRKLAEKTRTPAGTPPPFSAMFAPVQEESLSTPIASISVKVEEVDSIPLPTSAASECISQPSRSQSLSDSGDQADEDRVMQALNGSGSTSDSALPTPTDVKANALEHCNTGEPVLTVEAKEELVQGPFKATEESALAMSIDVTNSDSSSVQNKPRQETPMFSAYSSPFYSYPLLRSRSRVVADLASETYLFSSPSRASTAAVAPKAMIPDLRPLRVAVVSREAGSDLGRRICQFEVPGGGVCHDKTCTDLHLGDLEPDDHETARYLLETMPDVLQTYDESEIADQLLQARQKKSGLVKTSTQAASAASLEDAVADAIAALVGSGR